MYFGEASDQGVARSSRVRPTPMMKIYQILLKHFGKQNWWPCKTGRQFEIIVGAILTQNTNWKNVDKALDNLIGKNKLSRAALKKLSIKELSALIKPAGYYNQKARKLKEFVSYNGEITREALLSIWGVGPETADSILLYAYSRPYFVVDAYTKRVFSRMGLIKTNNYEEVRKYFESKLPKSIRIYKEFHALIVELAKRYCKKEPLCEECPLAGRCRKKL
jgi:endonuclease-3 related protein